MARETLARDIPFSEVKTPLNGNGVRADVRLPAGEEYGERETYLVRAKGKVKPDDDVERDGNEEEEGQSIQFYFNDIRETQYDSERNKQNARKVFYAEMAVYKLDVVLKSDSVPQEIKDKVKNLLDKPKARFLLKIVEQTVKTVTVQKRIKGEGLINTAAAAGKHKKWISRKIERNDDKLEKIVEDEIKIAQEGIVAQDALVVDNLRLAAQIAQKFLGRGLAHLDLLGYANEGLNKAAVKYNYRMGYAFSTYASTWIEQFVRRAITDHSRPIRLPVYIHDRLSAMSRAMESLEQRLDRIPTVSEIAGELGVSVETYLSIRDAQRVDYLSKLVVGEDGNSTELVNVIAVEAGSDTHLEVVDKIRGEKLREAMFAFLTKREREVLEHRFGMGEDGQPKTLDEVGKVFEVTRERIRQIEAKALKKLRSPKAQRFLATYL